MYICMTTLSYYIYSTQNQTSDRHKFVIENVEAILTKPSKQTQHPIHKYLHLYIQDSNKSK